MEGTRTIASERGVGAADRVCAERVFRGDPLVRERTVDRPVDAVQRTVGHAVRPEAQGDPTADDPSVGIVPDHPRASQSLLVEISRRAPLPHEVRLA